MVATNESKTSAVRICGLQKGFGSGNTRVEVLHGIDLDAHTGEILMLVGPSGCGKTTLLTLIAGLLDPDKGSIQVFGSDIECMSASQKTTFRRANIGFVFQQFNLIPTLTAVENAAVPLLIQDVAREAAVSRARSVLEQVNLGR